MRYDTQVTRDLENAHSQMGGVSVRGARRKNKVAITAAGRSYTVDVGKMEQRNDETGVVRQVRRLSLTGKGQSITITVTDAIIYRVLYSEHPLSAVPQYTASTKGVCILGV